MREREREERDREMGEIERERGSVSSKHQQWQWKWQQLPQFATILMTLIVCFVNQKTSKLDTEIATVLETEREMVV